MTDWTKWTERKPTEAGSDAVRVLEALADNAHRTVVFNRDTPGVSDERYHCAVDTYQTIRAALAAVKAQETSHHE